MSENSSVLITITSETFKNNHNIVDIISFISSLSIKNGPIIHIKFIIIGPSCPSVGRLVGLSTVPKKSGKLHFNFSIGELVYLNRLIKVLLRRGRKLSTGDTKRNLPGTELVKQHQIYIFFKC